MKLQITFLGAASLFGRVASALLRASPSIRKLKLYDDAECVQVFSSEESSCLVQWHRSKAQLTSALEGSDIVVIGDENVVTPETDRESLLARGSKIIDYAFAIAHTVPKAMLVVAASPLNVMVPLIGYVLKELGCYDGRKLLGVTSIDTLRANALYSSYLKQPNSILPVVGGASPQTRVPIFSHAKPYLQLPEEDQHFLIEEIKSFDLQIQGQDNKPSTIERAYATVRLVHSVISGLLEEPYSAEMALAKTALIPEVSYFSLPVDLGKAGIERTFGLPQLSPLELEMIDYAVINLNNDLVKAYELYAAFKPCFDLVKSITGHSLTSRGESCLRAVEYSDKNITKNHLEKTSIPNMKSYNRKRGEISSRKKTVKSPNLHCPAPDIIKDTPKAERFGRIKRARKQLDFDKIQPEKNANDLQTSSEKRKMEIDQLPIYTAEKTNAIKEEMVQIAQSNVAGECVSCARPSSKSNIKHNSEQKEILLKLKNIEIKPREKELKSTTNIKTALKTIVQEKNSKNGFTCITSIIQKELLERIEKESPYVEKKSSRRKYNPTVLKTNIKSSMNEELKGIDSKSSGISSSACKNNIKNKSRKKIVKQNPLVNSQNVKSEKIKPYFFQHKEKRFPIMKSTEKENLMEISKNGEIPEKINNGVKNNVKREDSKINVKEKMMSKKNSIDEKSELKDNMVEKTNNLRQKADYPEVEVNETEEGNIEKPENEMIKNKKENYKDNELDVKEEMMSVKNSIVEQSKKTATKKQEEADFSEVGAEEDYCMMEEGKIRKNEKKECITNIDKVLVNEIEPVPKANEVQKNIYNKTIEVNCSESNDADKPPSLEEYKLNKTPAITLDKKGLEANNRIENVFSKTFSCTTEILSADNEFTNYRHKNGDCGSLDPQKGYIDGEHGNKDIVSKEQCKERMDEDSMKKRIIKDDNLFFANTDILEQGDQQKENNTKAKLQELDKNDSEIIGELTKNKVFIANSLAQRNTNFDFDTREKIKVMGNDLKLAKNESLRKKNTTDKPVVTKQCDRSIYSINPLEQGNKIREITKHKLRESTKELKEALMQGDRNELLKNTKETVKGKNIQVFNYKSQQVNEKNVTNINDMLHDLVKESASEGITTLQTAVEGSDTHHTKENVYTYNETIAQDKVLHIMEPSLKDDSQDLKEHSKHTNKTKVEGNFENITAKEIDSNKLSEKQEPKISQELEPKKQPNVVTTLPLVNKNAKIVEDETFKKHLWLKQRIQPQPKGKSPTKINLEKVLENKKIYVSTHNIDQSFTQKGIKKGKQLTHKSNILKPITYTIGMKSKKEELSKRYTVLKKGQLCTMIKEDINANELKNKLYKKSAQKILNNINVKKENMYSLGAKDQLAEFEINKNISMNNNKSLKPILNEDKSDSENLPLEKNKYIPYSSSREIDSEEKNDTPGNAIRDVIHTQNLKQSNKNAINFENKNFFNLVLNRISNRAPTLSETNDTISIRGSHNASINNEYKKPSSSEEQQLINQQLIKKAKDQLKMTKIKNIKKGFNGISPLSFPVVSNDVSGNITNNTSKVDEKIKTNQKSMTDVKNKIQMLKDKYQHKKKSMMLKKYEVPLQKDLKETRMESSLNKIHNPNKLEKYTSVNVTNIVQKNKLEQKSASDMAINDKVQSEGNKQDILLSSFEKPVKEMVLHLLDKTTGSQISGKEESPIDTHVSMQYGRNDCSFDSEKNKSTDILIRNPQTVVKPIISVVTHDNNTDPPSHINQEKINSARHSSKISNENSTSLNENLKKDNDSKISKTINEKIKMNTNTILEKENKSYKDMPGPFKPTVPKKGVFQARAQAGEVYAPEKTKSQKTDILSKLDPSSKETKVDSNKSDINPLDKMSNIKNELSKYKPVNEKLDIKPSALNIFASRPSSKDLTKMKNETNSAMSSNYSEKSFSNDVKLGYGGMVENKLVPKHSSASSLLLDPNYEKRNIKRKEIHPNLLHAVKPFTSLHTDASKMKNNFYSRFTPQSLRANKEGRKENNKFKQQEGGALKNPFASGKVYMTPDMFKEYMRNNRNQEYSNATMDGYNLVSSLQSNRLAIAPPQTKINATKNQIMPFNTETNVIMENKGKSKNIDNKFNVMKGLRVPQVVIKTGKAEKEVSMKSQELFLNKEMKKNITTNENHLKGQSTKVRVKGNLYNSYKPYSSLKIKANSQPIGKISKYPSHFPAKDKEEEMKKMHLLKAFQDQEKTEKKFEELNRNFKKQKQIDTQSLIKPSAGRAFMTLDEGSTVEGTPKRLHLLKAFTQEQQNATSKNKQRTQRTNFSSPSDYHPSFPLSKPKKQGVVKTKEETTTSLKRRFTQLLDIFQSVISKEKKNWEHDVPTNKMLLVDGPADTKDTGSKNNIVQRQQRVNSARTKVQSYYRKHTSGKGNAGTSSRLT